jgi:hypothetical protein
MDTLYDMLSVTCFLGLVAAFLFLTTREPKTLMYLLVSALCFAVANQLGNQGQGAFALLLIVAGVGFAAIIIKS